uniref:Inducible T-cell costimulator n=1 Tax=Pelusios castaneus TaxID=367368 RepID=A0A8C8SZM1_9SAUR
MWILDGASWHFFPLSIFYFLSSAEQSPVSDPQVKVEFHNGMFKFSFSYPENVTDFSMTLLKGEERQKICALHMDNGMPISESNNSYCKLEYSGESMSFVLKDLESKHAGIYICCLQILLPAPYIDCRVNETYLYIYGKFTLMGMTLCCLPERGCDCTLEGAVLTSVILTCHLILAGSQLSLL